MFGSRGYAYCLRKTYPTPMPPHSEPTTQGKLSMCVCAPWIRLAYTLAARAGKQDYHFQNWTRCIDWAQGPHSFRASPMQNLLTTATLHHCLVKRACNWQLPPTLNTHPARSLQAYTSPCDEPAPPTPSIVLGANSSDVVWATPNISLLFLAR